MIVETVTDNTEMKVCGYAPVKFYLPGKGDKLDLVGAATVF